MKRRMKKIMTVAVTAAMAISMLAGCGSSDEKSEGSNAGSKEVNVCLLYTSAGGKEDKAHKSHGRQDKI